MSLTDKKRGFPDSCVALLDNRSREFGAELHMHKEMQILAGISGILEISVNSKKFNLRVGDMIIIKSRTPHSARSALPFTTTVSINLSPASMISGGVYEISSDLAEALTEGQKSYVYMRREDPMTSEIFPIITKINDEAARKEKEHGLFIEGYVKILLGMLGRYKKLETVSCDTEGIRRIAPAIAYADEHYAEDISLEDASAKLGMNREYFCRSFKRITGLTFVDYLNSVRVKRAEELLAITKKSISDISSETGFSSVSYFTRVFKSITDKTPAAFRNIKIFAD